MDRSSPEFAVRREKFAVASGEPPVDIVERERNRGGSPDTGSQFAKGTEGIQVDEENAQETCAERDIRLETQGQGPAREAQLEQDEAEQRPGQRHAGGFEL